MDNALAGTEDRALKYVIVNLGDQEWGNEVMDRVAREILFAYPDADMVEVREHGGWWLSYDRGLRVVYSANDASRWSDEVRAWRAQFNGCELVAAIRR